jgi:Uma2 family endonuclease
MSVTTPPTTGAFQQPPFPVRRFTVDEYHRLIQAGVLTEEDPVELLEGWIVPKMTRNPRHDVALDQSQEVLRAKLPAGWRLRIHSAITTNDSEPEPDVAVVRGPIRNFLSRHPGPQDIGVLIEISDSSLSHDRNDKGRSYARAGIVCYWIINLVDRQVEVYTDPTGPDGTPCYRRRQDYGVDQEVPLVLDGQEVARIAVRELLP